MAFRRGHYTADHREFGRFLLSKDMEDGLMPTAERIAAKARANTPTDTRQTRESIRVERGHRDVKGDRVAVHVIAEGAMVYLEFGTARQRAIRPMRRAAE